ncbi:MAG: DUF2505 family protein [Labilithrix sp.]
MPEITLRHEIETDEDTFWSKIVFDEGFNKKLYIDELEFPQWKLLEMKDDDAKISRRVLVEPATSDLPGPIKKAIGGDKLAYTEEGTFDKKSKRYVFKTIASLMPDKTKVSGEMWAEKIGDKKIRRIARMTVEVKIFMVGGMVEDRIIKDLQSSYDASTTFTNRYIKEHGL